jgi:glucoamylase
LIAYSREEISGDHFFTKMVQRKALILGAALANELNDPGAGQFYLVSAVIQINLIND